MDAEYDEEDLEEEKEEEAADRQKDYYDEMPNPKEKQDLYTLFKWIIARKDSSKIGFLRKEELGMLNLSVRDCQKIDLLGNVFNHSGFADFFKGQGEIVLATSLSREAHLIDLFVTTQKRTTKAREIQLQGLPQPLEKKRRLFGRR